MNEAASSDLAKHLDAVRIAVGELDALASIALRSFDDADWRSADSILVSGSHPDDACRSRGNHSAALVPRDVGNDIPTA